MSDPIVGIDLGTSNTVVAYADGASAVRVLADESGYKIHPSVVSFHPSGGVVVGAAAKQRKVIDPQNTIYSVKRLIGRTYHAPEVQTAKQRSPFPIKEGANQMPMIVTRGGEFAVPEISAIVLDHVRTVASVQLESEVSRAVVTVPASFNDAQRSATATAGAIAGLTIVRVLNEPTAAALAYGHTRSLKQVIAVYDFGGGTFDVTLLKLEDQVYEVLGTAGESFLGGDDLDERLVDKMVDRFLQENRIDLRSNEVSMMRLRAVAEQTKIELSRRSRAVVRIDEIAYGPRGAPLNLQIEISRDEFVGQVADIIDRTFPVCREAMDLAGLRAADIDDVILVGGTTKIPYVRDQVSKFFARAPRTDVNPEEAVAVGAALQAGSIDRVLARTPTGRIAAAVAAAAPAPSDTMNEDVGHDDFGGEEGSVTRPAVTTPTAAEPRAKRTSSMPISMWDDEDQPETAVRAPQDVRPSSPPARTPERTAPTAPAARGAATPGIAPMKQVPARTMFDVPAPDPRRPSLLPPKRPSGPPKRQTAPGPAAPRPPAANAETAVGMPRAAPDARTAVVDPTELPPVSTAPGVGPGRQPMPAAASAATVLAPMPISAPSTYMAVTPEPDPEPVVPWPPPVEPAPVMAMPPPSAFAATAYPAAPPVQPLPMPPPIQPRPGPAQPPPMQPLVSQRPGSAQPPPIQPLPMSPPVSQRPGPSQPPPIQPLPAPPPYPPPQAFGPQAYPIMPAPPPQAVPITPAQVAPPFVPQPPPFVAPPPEPAPVRAPVILDVTPRALGIGTVAGYCEELMRRNERVPAETRKTFTTSRDAQESVRIVVCQGESRRIENNIVLGDLLLEGIPARPRGETSIEVTFSLDASGILQVSARDAKSGAEQRARLDLLGAMPAGDVDASRERLQSLRR